MKSRSPRQRAERGATTIVVVMVMFLILALMAAYANRNLVFEQRIASNYVRSSVAAELAEAGVEWTLAQLNGRNIDAACAGNTGSSFRTRYLSQDASTRGVTPFAITNSKMAASCLRSTDSSWACQCPTPGQWADAAQAASSTNRPSFGVQFQPITRPGVLRIVSTGCTGSNLAACLSPMTAGAIDPLIGSATVRMEIALLSALQVPPAAPLVLRGTLTATDLGLHNADLRSGGALMNSGAPAPGNLSDDRLDSLPGTPASQALIGNDPTLQAASPDTLFRLFFGMPAGKYRQQPTMLLLQCSGDCSGELVNAYKGGARMIWISGPLTLSTSLVLGSTESPLLIVADGPVSLNGAVSITGLLYARGDVSWISTSGPAMLNGALISEGSVRITGHVDLWYQGSVMDVLSNATGSFVRVPASWTDG